MLTATTETGLVYNFTYDTYGNNTSVSIGTDEQKITSSATYNNNSNSIATTTDTAGNVTTYQYNLFTNVLESVQYPGTLASDRTIYTYDEMLRVASVVVGESPEMGVWYTYTDDLLTELRSASTTYTLSYGDFALRSGIQIGNRTLASYTYADRTNWLTSLDYGNGDGVDYTYDSQGRITKEIFEDGDTVTYRYDNSGALATVRDSASGITVAYYYDFSDRLMKYVESGDNYSHIVGYGYDSINNPTSLVETINGIQRTVTYAYDEDNRVTAVSDGTHSTHYTYDGYSRLSRQIAKHLDGNILTTDYTYRNPTEATTSGQVAGITHTATDYSLTLTYTYDARGNILSVNDGTYTTSYEYNENNQLVRENDQAAGKTWVYTYNQAGNLQTKTGYAYTTTEPGVATDTIPYGYSNATWGDLLTTYDGRTFTYDQIGNLLTDGQYTYTWEHGRELASISDATGTWTFSYDANGKRVSKVKTDAAGTVQETYRYIYNGSQLSRMTCNEDTLDFFYDASGRPVSVTYNGEHYYYVLNLQGDVIALLSSVGVKVVSYRYDAWGNPWQTTGTLANTLGELNPLRYRSYVYDWQANLYYLQSRYYNPDIGRFINADAYISTGQGILGSNMFTYCGGNPVNRIDTTGRFWESMLDVISLGASIVEVCVNPIDPWAWAGLVGDTVDLIPFVTGVGELTKATKATVKVVDKTDDIIDAAKTIYKAEDIASDIHKATGSYEIIFSNGFRYVGKGGFDRAIASASRFNNEEILNILWKSAPDKVEAFIDEFFMQKRAGGVLSFNKNAMVYNKIWSPGRRYYEWKIMGK